MGMVKIRSDEVQKIARDVLEAVSVFGLWTNMAIKTLLETKYLYQNIKLLPDDNLKSLEKRLRNQVFKDQFAQSVQNFKASSLGFGFKIERCNGCTISHRIYPPETVNTSCELCRCVTPHNPVRYNVFDCGSTLRGFDETIALQLQCQKCKQGGLVVLFRRTGLNLQLVGRNQIECGIVGFDMPYLKDAKFVQDIFVQAIMADRTGSHLAACCLLRVAVEQYMRAVVQEKSRRLTGDELYERFNQALPGDFPRDRVTSLGLIYGRLSEIMHCPSTYIDGEFLELLLKIEKFMAFAKLMPPGINESS